jgi:hypothetical protein
VRARRIPALAAARRIADTLEIEQRDPIGPRVAEFDVPPKSASLLSVRECSQNVLPRFWVLAPFHGDWSLLERKVAPFVV